MQLRLSPDAVLLLVFLLRFAAPSDSAEGPVVRVAAGELRGLRTQRAPDSPLRTLYEFRGIPYARAPVGQRRFKDPEEVEPWSGIKNATAYGPNCVQKIRRTGNVIGEEDCLYLNVFTADPPEKWSNGNRSVILYIHGGAFIMWSGNLDSFRADPILRNGIVFVTLNYRLGVMGFLNTEDAQAPGNAGLKDQAMALRWVQRNIAVFGGDPDNVAIMGESAGGASVHYHLLSPLSRGLFRRAISVSGSALPTWTGVQQPRRHAVALRRRFAAACADLADDAIVTCLQRVDANRLVFGQYDVPLEQFQNYFLKSTFLPSVEATSTGSERFLTADPEQLMKEGRFAKVPYMTGFTSAEGIIILRFGNLLEDPSRWAEVDEHFEDIFRWEMPPGQRTREAARQLRHFYLGNLSLRDANQNNETLQKFVQLCTDNFFAVGTAKSATLMAEHGVPVYVYQFSRDGPIAFLKNFDASHIPGVMHGDDMAYVFDFVNRTTGQPRPVPSSEQPIRERQLKIFTNFAKTGNPTPDGGGLVRWPALTPDSRRYLDMDVELTVHDDVLARRFDPWGRLANAAQPTATKTATSSTRESTI